MTKTEGIIVVFLWVLSIILTIGCFARMSRLESQHEIDEIDMEDAKIEKDTRAESLDQLVRDNNKS